MLSVFHATREKPEPSNIVGSLDSLAPEQVRKYLSKVGALVHPNQKSQEHASFMTYGNDKTDVWALGFVPFTTEVLIVIYSDPSELVL